MPVKAIQQFALRSAFTSRQRTGTVLRLAKEAGYEGIELCDFLTHPVPLSVRALTRLAKMPVGNCGRYDWKRLMEESGLCCVGFHADLGSIQKRPEEIAARAKDLGTDNVVITAVYRYDYTNKDAVLSLAAQLNGAGERLSQLGVKLLYHNHNCELSRIEGRYALLWLLEYTDPRYVHFEFDSYWPTEAGCDALALMKTLGTRVRLYHINDRGFRAKGKGMPIVRSDGMELGDGNMDLPAFAAQAKAIGVEAVILETHRNWVDNSPVASFQRSAAFMNRHFS